MIRRRNISLKSVKELDAFPKIPEDYRKHSAVGGTFSILSFGIIVYLIYAETLYFLESRLQFKFEPDVDYDSKLQMNVDLTVAMPCTHLGADILDSTSQNLMTSDTLQEEDTWWDLSPDQRAHFEALKHMNSYLREEYHAVHELLWKSNQLTYTSDMPERTQKPSYPPDACRIYGTLSINKVAGNFHVTAGKSLTFPKGHVHFSGLIPHKEYNFTHRINQFSFGTPSPGIIHPLEGDEKITTQNMMLFQYFIEVVPTDIEMFMRTTKTFQYSVKDHESPVGFPGIFFKYDTSALKVKVTQERDSIGQFLVKLCATVGCIFVTNGLLNNLVQNFWYILCCQFWRKEEKNHEKMSNKPAPIIKPVNLLNVLTTPSEDNVDIIAKPQ